VASAQGVLWVLERFGLRKVNASGTVIGDPIDVGRAVGCTLLGGLGCTATIAAGEGSAWVLATSHDQPGSGEGDSHLAKVNPQTNAVESFTLRNLAPGGAFGSVPVAVGEGWVWSADRNPPSLLRIDPKDPRRVDRFRLAAPGDGLGVGFGSVWVRHNSGIQSFVSRVDPDTGGVIATIHVPGSADGIAFGGGNVWISDSTGDELIRVDPVTNTIAAHFPVGKDPQAVAVDEEGTVWVNLTGEGTTTDAGELAKVEPTTGAVVGTVPLPGSGGLSGIPTRRMNVVFAFGSIWVA
jgi:streptogramin lyase